MRTLNFSVENQNLSKGSDFFNVEGTVGYLYAQFDFLTDDWNGTVKKAFFQNKSIGAKSVLLTEDKCKVPPEILAKSGLIEVSVEGITGENYKITTSTATFFLSKTLNETDVEDFTPDMFQQIVGLIDGKADNITYEDPVLSLKSGDKVLDTVTIAGGGLPTGIIAIWSGSADNVPVGWQLCDGTNGTPDLRDKFVLGAGTTYAVGDNGGEETHTLTENEMPAHSHIERLGNPIAYDYGFSINGSLSGKAAKIDESVITTREIESGLQFITTRDTGGTDAHNNMPPYYTLCYIMKIA